MRVFINGIRISESDSIYVPIGADRTWTLFTFSSNYEAGTFELSRAITEDDTLRVDFDISFT